MTIVTMEMSTHQAVLATCLQKHHLFVLFVKTPDNFQESNAIPPFYLCRPNKATEIISPAIFHHFRVAKSSLFHQLLGY